MNSRALILALSLVGNVVLAVFVVRQRDNSSASAESSTHAQPVAAAEESPSTSREAVGTAESAAAMLVNSSSDSPGGFRWSQLEAADYKEYIARLRAFGVPEKVVRDIIIADVGKLYRPRFAALRPPKKPKNPNFWETRGYSYNTVRAMTNEQREQTRTLRKEQTELIRELLGAGVYEEMAKDSGYPDYTERMYGPLSKEVREKISGMQERFQDEQSAFYAKIEGYMDQDSQAEMAAIRKKFRAELATVLTPEQLEDYELRSSETAQRMKWELSSFDPDEKEFRAIHAHKQALEELDAGRNSEDKPLTPDEQKELQKKRKELEASLADKLGTNRVAEYKLMDQYEYRNLLEAGVPKESVFKIPDIKKEAEAAASKLRKDKTLTDEQRNAALQAIKDEATKTLADLLGSRRANYYQQSGGWWLRNLAPQTDQP
jgi:hypothetical protein